MLSVIAISIGLSGCTTVHVGGQNPSENQLEENSTVLQAEKDQQRNTLSLESGKNLRLQAIEQAYYTYHFQKSVIDQYDRILESIKPMETSLNEIFNFKRFIYNENMIYPVIEESNEFLAKSSDRTLVANQKRWKIIKDARVMISPPTWSDYLQKLPTETPLPIDPIFYPKTPEEESAMKKGKNKGIADGKPYAQELFSNNLFEMKRDYSGMMSFKSLRLQNMVDDPILAVNDNHIVHSEDGRELIVGQKNYRITKDSTFNPAQQWKPLSGNIIYQKRDNWNPPSYDRLKEIQDKDGYL